MLSIAIGFVLLVIMLIIGVPVMYCFGAALIFCSMTLGYEPTMIFPTMYGKLSSVVLLSIPCWKNNGTRQDRRRTYQFY